MVPSKGRYQLDGKSVIFEWLAHEPDMQRRLAVLDWLVEVSEHPFEAGQRLPGVRAPVLIGKVSTKPPVMVRYLIADQFHTVRIIKIAPLG